MNAPLTVAIIAAYFVVLMLISYFTGKDNNNKSFFLGNKKSPWFVVAIGMIGTSLSGVTFISVPGWVENTQFTYMQMVFGYFLGYIVIAHILLPVYYRLNLTSIYTYLEGRFGKYSYKSGASLFLVSRTIGAAARLYLVANVLQITLFNSLGVPFAATVIVTIALIWLYTFRGGIKTIIWTDTLQTIFLLSSVIITIVYVANAMDLNFSQMLETINNSEMSKVFEFKDWSSKQHFLKQFLSGAFITIVMTGLDQDMMQKNLSCRNLKDAKKNMLWYGFAFIPTNLLFLSLGALLYIFVAQTGTLTIDGPDSLFPMVVTSGLLPQIVGIFFILGLVAAAYSSADSALTSLTTSFSVDILGYRKSDIPKKRRFLVHLLFSVLLAVVILTFRALQVNNSIIDVIFDLAGYTYGPLLGLYAFGLFTKIKINDKCVPYISILAPLVTIGIYWALKLYANYTLGYEKLMLNGLLTFAALYFCRKKDKR